MTKPGPFNARLLGTFGECKDTYNLVTDSLITLHSFNRTHANPFNEGVETANRGKGEPAEDDQKKCVSVQRCGEAQSALKNLHRQSGHKHSSYSGDQDQDGDIGQEL
jgi:hypothetical protein